MSNVILCEKTISEMPFFLESVSKHIYSMEELYYFVYSNPYLAAWDLMNEEFCNWMQKNDFGNEMACELRKIVIERQSQAKFLSYLIRNTNYYSEMEREELWNIFEELENKTMLECVKMKADYLMRHRKFISAMKEYKRILASEEIKILSPDLVGNIWNNLGTAYAKMFFYEEAMWCFKKAYAYNNNPKSLRAMECAKKQAADMNQKLLEINEFYQNQKSENHVLDLSDCNKVLHTKFDTQLLQWRKEYLNMSDLKDWSCELENEYI